MKKFITSAALFAASTALASAAYVWTGAESSDWATQGNWELTDNSSWTANSNGPGASDSNMYDEICFNGSKYTTAPVAPSELEGWAVKLNLLNGANVTLTTKFKKWQTDALNPSYVKVDGTSSLTISATTENFKYRDVATNFDIYSYEGLKLTSYVWTKDTQMASPNFNINLHDLGSVTAAWSLSGDINIVFTADLKYSETNEGQYSVASTSEDGNYRVISRVLWVNTADNGGTVSLDGHTFTLDGETLQSSSSALTASAEDVGKYYIEKVDNGLSASNVDGKNIVVSYVVAIPEPSAFGLLAGAGALALVAARRRRRSRKA